MKYVFKFFLLTLIVIFPAITILSGCNSIEGSDKRIPNVGKMDDPDEHDLKF